MTLSISVRVAAFVSLCCGSYMAVKSYQNRHLIFHRLMLGLSLHLIMYCCWSIYGTSAVPYQEDAEFNVWGARGTTSTCTAQGFFAQLGQAVAFYYVGLSFYSFQAVRFNFQIEKYRWVEHCIHIFVNLWAFGSAIYLLTIEAYNPSKHSICYIHSRPLACEHDPATECLRGPDNASTVIWIFGKVCPSEEVFCSTFFLTLLPYCCV